MSIINIYLIMIEAIQGSKSQFRVLKSYKKCWHFHSYSHSVLAVIDLRGAAVIN